MTIEFTESIERFFVTLPNKKRTTVSMDGVLCKVMCHRLGSIEALDAWIKHQATVIGERKDLIEKRTTIGLSRLIQQQAIVMVAGETLSEELPVESGVIDYAEPDEA